MDARFRFGYWILAVLIFYSIVASSVLGDNRRPKNVQAALRAKWSGTPLLLEAGELLSKEWNDLFWNFIDSWLRAETEDPDPYTARDCFMKIVKYGRSLLSEPLVSVFEFSLALRSSSPRLVLYRQLGRESLSSFPQIKQREGDFLGVNPRSPRGNCCWADTGSVVFLEVADFSEWIRNTTLAIDDHLQQPELFDFDHVHPNSNHNAPSAILYGALGTSCFQKFHTMLSEASKDGKIKYVLRPLLPSGCEGECTRCGAIGTGDYLPLGGYGVELALKNMEYKAMDDSDIRKGITLEDPHTEDLTLEVRGFIFSRILDRKPELLSGIMAFRDYLLSSTISDTLNVWELKDLGHQTAQRILFASDPFQSMQEISHNFPSVVSSLSRTKLNDSIKDEIISNQQMMPPGKSLMALNGALVNVEDIDIYMLFDMVHQELSLADQFLKLQIPQSTVKKLLLATPPSETSAFRVDFRSSHVHYINNLEKDAMYKRWRSNINDILMPVFPGQLRYIRKNIFHAVYVFDPASSSGLAIVDMIISLYENGLPIRFGVVLYSAKLVEIIETNSGVYQLGQLSSENLVGDDISTMVIRLFLFIEREYGIQIALQFLTSINKLRIDSGTPGEYVLELHQIEGAFVDTLLSKTESPPQDLLLKLEGEHMFRVQSEESSFFVYKMGLRKLHSCLLMNGLVFDPNEEDLVSAMNDELPRIQEHVYYGRIDSQTDVLDKLLSESGIKRYNPQISGAKIKPKYISLSKSFFMQENMLKEINYLHTPATIDNLKPVTHLLVADVTKMTGWKLLHEGMRYLLGDAKRSRLGILFSINTSPNSPASVFMQVFQITTSLYSNKKNMLEFLYQVSDFYGHNYLASSTAAENGDAFMEKVLQLAEENSLPSDAYRHVSTGPSLEKLRDHLRKVMEFVHELPDVAASANAVITNGRVFIVEEGGTFLSDDFHLLESVEFEKKIKHIAEIVGDVNWVDMDPDLLTSNFISDVIMLVSSSISSCDRSTESARFEMLSAKYSAIIFNNEDSNIHVDAVVDPLSSIGQKLSALLHVVQKYAHPSMRIVLNPLSSLVDLPLKNFYRFVVPGVDDFSSSDSAVTGPKAFFANMPLLKTLTMNLDVPESWLVEPIVAFHDLDNILLENLRDTRTLTAIFELEALVLTGHCTERDRDPPQGLQLVLGTKSSPHLVDTLVMANLGYWQMKVFPGVWSLQLADGRSSELYMLKDGTGHLTRVLSNHISIDDLRGKLVNLEVWKKEGKEHEKLLLFADGGSDLEKNDGNVQNNWNSNIFKWASSLIGGNDEGRVNRSRKKTSLKQTNNRRQGRSINIFSVASGHLYERFLKIMILSVLKNTNRPVKFWFIKNYLSPQFKDVIPLMAHEYGFDFELITYKWPSWLHKQKEKQRIIWAYKILFLDVIFPLSLEKVIFVDADQVVRADMGELYDMNIMGRPLAYTPFCDNNKDMDGFRFWRQGFWREHLRGKPYHISALYVVDLIKFRETAAGDNLRVFYETLSKDPNSLSNLDQDLPNYAQHTVPIFSLPQEWLWCESWCGNSTKSKAKTIDLCNNPMTKEPKLQGARRIISEWLDLDTEARNFTAKVLGEGDSHVSVVSQSHQGIFGLSSSVIDKESKSEL